MNDNSKDMSVLPALHPTRVRETLRTFTSIAADGPSKWDTYSLTDTECQTCLAALKVIAKGQEITGLTSNIADAGQAGMKLLSVLSKLAGRK